MLIELCKSSVEWTFPIINLEEQTLFKTKFCCKRLKFTIHWFKLTLRFTNKGCLKLYSTRGFYTIK